MTTPQKFYTTDAGLIFREPAQAPVTADGYIGVQKDLKGAVLTEMVMIVNMEDIKTSAGNEAYTFRVVGANEPGRSDARVLATAVLGANGAKPEDTVDDAIGDQLVLRYATARNGVNFRYTDLHLEVGGTAPSITFSAYASKHE